MAFKLKSPFHATPVGQTLGKGGTASGYSGTNRNYNMFQGIDYAEAEGSQNLEPPPSNETTERLVKMGEDGVPLSLNPKQEMRRKIKADKKEIKDAKKEERQTESAKKMSQKYFGNTEGMTNDELDKKNFEEEKKKTDAMFKEYEDAGGNEELYDMLDEKYKRGKYAPGYKAPASKDYDGDGKADNAPIKPINQEEEMNKRYADFKDNPEMIDALDQRYKRGKYAENTAPKNNFVMNREEKFINPILQMKGKPNRAGTPVRMLKSMEDKTPVKYKSVRKTARENLMSALAKQGEPIGKNDLGTYVPSPPSYSVERKPLKPASEIKSNPNFATPGTEFKATKPGESNQPKRVTVGDRAKESVKKAVKFSVAAALKKGEPVKKEMVNDFTMNMDDSTSLELPKPVKKMRPKKANIKNSKSKGKSGKVTMDRKVSTKF